MKKNLIPLLGIAFLVALIATAVFYGLVVSKVSASSDAPPVTDPAAAPQKPVDLALTTVPIRMRAVSVQISDSSGVLSMLQEGNKVDIQAVYTRSGGKEIELKTILENIQVLKIDLHPEAEAGRPVLPVVTLLATPAEADVLGLADSAARLRLALRNPKDTEKSPRTSVALSSMVQDVRPMTLARQTGAAAPSHLPPLKGDVK